MAKDFFGRELLIGDRVIYTQAKSGDLRKGIIEKLNPSMVRIRKVDSWKQPMEDNWEPYSGAYGTTLCSNHNIFKL